MQLALELVDRGCKGAAVGTRTSLRLDQGHASLALHRLKRVHQRGQLPSAQGDGRALSLELLELGLQPTQLRLVPLARLLEKTPQRRHLGSERRWVR